jgi:hypothetical protein
MDRPALDQLSQEAGFVFSLFGDVPGFGKQGTIEIKPGKEVRFALLHRGGEIQNLLPFVQKRSGARAAFD